MRSPEYPLMQFPDTPSGVWAGGVSPLGGHPGVYCKTLPLDNISDKIDELTSTPHRHL